MTNKNIDQSGQTIHGSQVNANRDVNIAQLGDTINTNGGDYIARDKIHGDVVVTGSVTGSVIVNYTQRPTILPSPSPLRPPQVDLLIGREIALATHEGNLQQFGLTIISGMAGIGKTTLAATLARRQTSIDNIFWHVFHEGEGVDSIIWRLAGFLATHGQDSPWRMLHTTMQTGGQPPPPTLLFDFLIEELRDKPYLLCLDDFQHVDEDPYLLQLVARLQPLLATGGLRLIITTRRTPSFIKELKVIPLKGLDVISVRHLLAANDIAVDADIITQLHRYTGGNAALLTLAIDLLHGVYDPTTLVQNLIEADNIEDFLMDEIEGNLSRNERLVMGAVAILQGYPGSRAAIEAIIDGRRVRRVLHDLSDRFLLTVSRTTSERLYSQHAIIEAFFYDGLNQRERRRMHQRAGIFYRDSEPDHLLAARHFYQSGDFSAAADLATADVLALINKGAARQLSRLFKRFDITQLDNVRWLKVQLGLGQIHAYFGENPSARAVYENILTLVERGPDSEATTWYPRVCLALGDLLALENPPEALTWYARGMAAMSQPVEDKSLQAALLIGQGTVQMYLNDFELAQAALHAGLAHLPQEATQRHVTALENLAVVSANAEGDFAQAIALGQQALELSRQLNDSFKSVEIMATLGTFYHMDDDWAAAIQLFEQALEAAQQLGNERMMAQVLTNLGGALMYSGDYDQAHTLLQQGLTAARNTHQQLGECLALKNLAQLNQITGQWSAAHQQLTEVEALAKTLSMDFIAIAVWRIRAELALAEGTDNALSLAQYAVEVAQTQGDPIDEGYALKIWAQALATTSEREKATAIFSQSYNLLKAEDRFGTALCQVAWGAYLLPDDPEQATILIQYALTTFEYLGAYPERHHATQLLKQIALA